MSIRHIRLPGLHLYVGQFVFILLVLQSLSRLTFFITFSSPADPVPVNEILWSFYLGLKYDIQFSLILSLPILLFGWIGFIHPVYSRPGKRLWMSYVIILILLLFIVHAANFGYYAYLKQNIDATALRFLKDPIISLTMVWQSYPVISGVIVLIALLTGCYQLLKTANKHIDDETRLNIKWKAKTSIVLVTFIVVFTGLLGKISWYPLRWSDAFFSSEHPFTAYLASNPVLYFANTLENHIETYDIDATRKYYPLMTEYLGIDNPDIDTLNFTRKVTFENTGNKTPVNVVIVVLESFSTYKSGLSGNPLKPTPNFDAIARNGYYFNNFFIPHTGTARSIWALVTGIPDIEKKATSSRNPLIVDQKMIINDFKNYNKYYFLGGSASWANIRGLLASNIDNLEIYEEGSYESPKIDVWGISDLDLFKEANKVFKQNIKPFFSIIQTSGFHRPYTIPDDNNNFEFITEDNTEHKITDNGFIHMEEYNAFRFMDHSVGEFIRMARNEDYFDNTIFVFFGDHGLISSTGKHMPVSEAALELSGFRVPLVIYAPKILGEPKTIEKAASSVDVIPTVASLTKTSHTNTTIGRDLFDTKFENQRYSFTVFHRVTRTIGVITKKLWERMQFDETDQILYRLDTDTPRKNVANKHPKEHEDMSTLTKALKETILYMRENNRKQ